MDAPQGQRQPTQEEMLSAQQDRLLKLLGAKEFIINQLQETMQNADQQLGKLQAENRAMREELCKKPAAEAKIVPFPVSGNQATEPSPETS